VLRTRHSWRGQHVVSIFGDLPSFCLKSEIPGSFVPTDSNFGWKFITSSSNARRLTASSQAKTRNSWSKKSVSGNTIFCSLLLYIIGNVAWYWYFIDTVPHSQRLDIDTVTHSQLFYQLPLSRELSFLVAEIVSRQKFNKNSGNIDFFYSFKSLCLREWGRPGNRGRPISFKFGTQSCYEKLCNMPKF